MSASRLFFHPAILILFHPSSPPPILCPSSDFSFYFDPSSKLIKAVENLMQHALHCRPRLDIELGHRWTNLKSSSMIESCGSVACPLGFSDDFSCILIKVLLLPRLAFLLCYRLGKKSLNGLFSPLLLSRGQMNYGRNIILS